MIHALCTWPLEKPAVTSSIPYEPREIKATDLLWNSSSIHRTVEIVAMESYCFHFLWLFWLVNKPQKVVAGCLCHSIRKTTKRYIRWRCLLVAGLTRKLNRGQEYWGRVQKSIWPPQVHLSFSQSGALLWENFLEVVLWDFVQNSPSLCESQKISTCTHMCVNLHSKYLRWPRLRGWMYLFYTIILHKCSCQLTA